LPSQRDLIKAIKSISSSFNSGLFMIVFLKSSKQYG
jgi:hypothetical protein